MEQLKIRKLLTQPSEKLCLADGEKKIDLGELQKQLRSEKLGLSEGERACPKERARQS